LNRGDEKEIWIGRHKKLFSSTVIDIFKNRFVNVKLFPYLFSVHMMVRLAPQAEQKITAKNYSQFKTKMQIL